MTPCPICKLADKTLVAGDYLGRCYQCDVVGLEQLLDEIYLPQKPVEKKPKAVVSRKAKPAPKPALKPPNVKPKVPGPLSSAFPNRHGSNQFSISRAVKPGVVARKAVANG